MTEGTSNAILLLATFMICGCLLLVVTLHHTREMRRIELCYQGGSNAD